MSQEEDEIVHFIENRLAEDGSGVADFNVIPWSQLSAHQRWTAVWHILAMLRDNDRGMKLLERLLTEGEECIPPHGARLLAELIFPKRFEEHHFDMKLRAEPTKAGTKRARRFLKSLERTGAVLNEMRRSKISKTKAIEKITPGSVRNAFRTFVSPKPGQKPFAPWEDD